MKNVRYQPNNPTETRTISARTQIAKQHSELGISDLHRNIADYIAPNPRQQICPAAADTPGVRRWSPEDGGEGLRRVLLLRPLVRRKATIKSTGAMMYSSWKKPEKTIQAKRRYLIKNERHKPTASQTSRTASLAEAARLGTGCQGILVPAAREYRRLQVKNNRARDRVPDHSRFATPVVTLPRSRKNRLT